MVLGERSQELTAAFVQRRRAPDEMLPHQGAIVCADCTEVVRESPTTALPAASQPQSREPISLMVICCGRPASAACCDPFAYIVPAMRAKRSQQAARWGSPSRTMLI